MGCASSVPQVELASKDTNLPRCHSGMAPVTPIDTAAHCPLTSSAVPPDVAIGRMSPLKPSAPPLIIAGCEDVKEGRVGESGNINTETFPGAPKLGSLPIVRDEPSKYPITRKLRTDRKVRELYRLGKTLGTGGFSVVRLAIDRQTHAEYACKIMSLPSVGQQVGENESTREDIFKEIDILCALNHENVIFLKEYFEEDNKVYLITEMLTGGELLEAVLSRGTYTEHEARCCFVQLLRGIQYLHSRGVVHRDLKLENLLLARPGDIRHIKIADFGLAKRTAPNSGLQTVCGTPQYVAPEVIVGLKGHKYGPEVDMWSAGVVLFILLGGYPPFWSDSEPVLFDQIRQGAFTFSDPVWNNVTHEAKDLIRHLLVTNPERRLTATAALAHPWVVMQPMHGRPPSGPPGQAPTHPSPLTPFTLAASPGRGQGAGTPPGGLPRLGVAGRGGPGPGAGPEGGRAAALAFIRSLEVPAFTPRHPAAAGPPAEAPKASPLASSPPPAAAPREAAAAVGPPAGTGMQHSAVPAATSSKNEAGAASPSCHGEGTASPCLSGAGAAAVASGKEGLAGGGAMNANGSPMSGALLSHAITLASSLSVMEGSVTSGTSPDSHRASGLNVQVAQQLANLSDKPKEVQEALASVGEVLAHITSGSLTELANEDLLLLLNTKDGLLQHLPDKWLQAAVNKSLAEGGRTLPRHQPGI